jgi:hypothetical protein
VLPSVLGPPYLEDIHDSIQAPEALLWQCDRAPVQFSPQKLDPTRRSCSSTRPSSAVAVFDACGCARLRSRYSAGTACDIYIPPSSGQRLGLLHKIGQPSDRLSCEPSTRILCFSGPLSCVCVDQLQVCVISGGEPSRLGTHLGPLSCGALPPPYEVRLQMGQPGRPHSILHPVSGGGYTTSITSIGTFVTRPERIFVAG